MSLEFNFFVYVCDGETRVGEREIDRVESMGRRVTFTVGWGDFKVKEGWKVEVVVSKV